MRDWHSRTDDPATRNGVDMWINKLKSVTGDDALYVKDLVTESEFSFPTVEIPDSIRITFIMDRHADGYIIVELLDPALDRFDSEVYAFESTIHALTEWTEIVADYTNQNLFDSVRKAFS